MGCLEDRANCTCALIISTSIHTVTITRYEYALYLLSRKFEKVVHELEVRESHHIHEDCAKYPPGKQPVLGLSSSCLSDHVWVPCRPPLLICSVTRTPSSEPHSLVQHTLSTRIKKGVTGGVVVGWVCFLFFAVFRALPAQLHLTLALEDPFISVASWNIVALAGLVRRGIRVDVAVEAASRFACARSIWGLITSSSLVLFAVLAGSRFFSVSARRTAYRGSLIQTA